MSAEAERSHPPDGHRWVVNAHYSGPNMVPTPDKPGWYHMDPEAKPDSYGVVDAFNWAIQRGQFKTEAAAHRKADELNRLDVQGPIEPEFKHRRDRLKRLAPDFGSWVYEGPPAARWPARPKRYAVYSMGHGWHPEDGWDLADNRAELEELLADEENTVGRIVDLDTGKDVPFTRDIAVSVELPELQKRGERTG